MDRNDGCSRLPVGMDGLVNRRGWSLGDADHVRWTMANAVTAILLQAEVIRRHAPVDGPLEPVLENATEQITLNARRIWNQMEATVLNPTA